MTVEYNRSDNAARAYTVEREGGFSGLGRRWEDLRCPFCGTVSRAFVWSLHGGGKVCVNRKCGAKFGKGGTTMPRVGREEMQP